MSELDKGKWKKEIEQLRAEKDEWMRTSPNSPIPHEIRHHMKGLEYFPPNPACVFAVKLNRYPNPEKLTMTTSKGKQRDFLRYGFFEFPVEGKTQTLQAYMSIPALGHQHEEQLFVAFRDSTSGKESYGAARYIDLGLDPSGEYMLDFNLAYNPYCAYSDDYVCPLPPQENWLRVPIVAGEKNFPRPGH
jgi:uncharacterized protein (DUF1684 family)